MTFFEVLFAIHSHTYEIACAFQPPINYIPKSVLYTIHLKAKVDHFGFKSKIVNLGTKHHLIVFY